MANEGELTLRFKVADDGSIVLDKIGKKITEVESNTKSMSKSLSLIKIDSIINLGERAYQTGEQIYRMAKEVAGALNDIERCAKVANMTTGEYQKMAYAAKMSDVSIEELSTGMKKLSVNMDEALKEGGIAADKFARIGVSVKDSDGKMKSLNQIMLEIADQFSTWEDGPRKIAIAVDLFGRSGERLIPYLNQGAAGIKEFYQEAERLGVVLDEKMIKAGSELENKFKRLESWWTSLKYNVVMGSAGIIEAAGTAYDVITNFVDSVNLKLETLTGIHREATAKATQNIIKTFEDEDARLGKLMAASIPKSQAPEALASKLKKDEETSKVIREQSLSFLQRQEETLKRMVELQGQLNKSGEEAIAIAERLGVSTKASLTQWIDKDIVGEYEKLLGSGLFSDEEMEQFKAKYTEALQSAMGEGGWGSEYRQIEEAINRINTMKLDETQIQQYREEMDLLGTRMKELVEMSGPIKLDDSKVIEASRQVDELRIRLEEITSQSWNVNINVTGTGSSEKPILEKIEEVQNAFQTMGSEVGNMVLQMNLSKITAEISELEKRLYYNVAPIWASDYVKKGIEVSNEMYREQIADLNYLKKILIAAASYTPESQTYGGGGGEVSININTINVGESMQTVAEQLDAELADLWYKNRSKLKVAIQG